MNKGTVTTVVLVGLAVAGATLIGYGVKNLNNADKTVQVESVPVNSIQKSTEVEVKSKKVTQLDLTDKQVITIYGPIGDESYSIAKQITNLGKTGKPIYVLINSPGGSVLDGALIASAIEASPVPVYTVCEQLCASMAFIIHQHGHTRMMVDRALLMGHPATGGLQGTLEQMQSRLSTIQRYVNKFNAKIAKRAGLSLEQFQSMVVSEMWLDAEDSTDKSFNDKIVNVILNVPQPNPNLLEELKKRNEAKQRVDIRW